MRYGNAKVGLGPGVVAPVSRFSGFASDLSPSVADDEEGGGGGSMTDGAGDGFEIGSGRAGMGSSADDVSIVMCLVTGGDCLRV